MRSSSFKKTTICLFLVIATACVYWQIGRHGTVNADDFYITEEPLLKLLSDPDSNVRYVTTQNLIYVFTNTTAGVWMLFPQMLVGAEHLFFGRDYGIHHLICMALHILNAILVFLIFYRMTHAMWKSAFVAALFALHPLNAEPVAWLVGIRVTLSAFFGLLMVYSYVVYTQKHTAPRFILTITLFACCLASVPMFPTLPFVLLLLDYWPLERIRFSSPSGAGSTGLKKWSPNLDIQDLIYLLVEKAPYIVMLGIASAGMLSCHGLDIIHRYPLDDRILNAILSYPRYISHTLFPVKLAAFYPFPRQFYAWEVGGAALFLIGVTLIALRLATSRPYLIIGWLWFTGMMVPLSGIAQIGTQAMADHYMYLPGIGLYVIITWGISDLASKLPNKTRVLSIGAGLALVALMALTWRQAGYWKDSKTLARHSLAVTEGNYEAYNYLGQALAEEGDYDAAIAAFTKALAIKPDHFKSNFNMAMTLTETGRKKAAIAYYRTALAIYPDHTVAHNNLAGLLVAFDKIDEAIDHYREALRIQPDYYTARHNLASLLMRQKRYQKAIAHYAKLLQSRPNTADLYAGMAIALYQTRQYKRAQQYLNRALTLNPENQKARWLLQLMRQKQ